MDDTATRTEDLAELGQQLRVDAVRCSALTGVIQTPGLSQFFGCTPSAPRLDHRPRQRHRRQPLGLALAPRSQPH